MSDTREGEEKAHGVGWVERWEGGRELEEGKNMIKIHCIKNLNKKSFRNVFLIMGEVAQECVHTECGASEGHKVHQIPCKWR